MAYQALYRKWRPRTFDDVLGQTAAVKTLRRQIETGNTVHAYLFCGCRGTGKTSLAKIMSQAVNCEHPVNGNPCGVCPSCKAILSESSLDVIEMDAASNSKVEEMRTLLEQVVYPPAMCRYKVFIIDEVHMLSGHAFNALLKTLEEPPEYMMFILATTEPLKIPATILSRVQRYDFGRIPMELMIGRMKLALDELGLKADEEALHLVARSAEGAMRDAFSILDMCVSAADGGTITEALVRDLLGNSDRSFLFSFFDSLAERDTGAVIRKIDEMVRKGKDVSVFIKDISSHCRFLLTVKSVKENTTEILGITPEEEKEYRSQAEKFSLQRLLSMQEMFLSVETTLKNSAFPRIGLESVSLKACEDQKGEDNNALVERIGELEGELKQLKTKIAEGSFVVQAAPSPASSEAAKKAPKKQAVQEAVPEVPVADAALWKQCLGHILSKLPSSAAFLKKVSYIGIENNELLLGTAEENRSIIAYLNQQNRHDTILELIREVYQKDLTFRIVTPGEKAKAEADTNAAEKQLFQTFGRDQVEIINGDTEAK